MEPELYAIGDYLLAHIERHGHARTAEAFGVSRHTLWRFLERGQPGLALPRAVMAEAGETAEAIRAATHALTGERQAGRQDHSDPLLPRLLRDTLLALCAVPFTSVDELTSFERVPSSTLRARAIAASRGKGLADARPRRLAVPGRPPTAALRPDRCERDRRSRHARGLLDHAINRQIEDLEAKLEECLSSTRTPRSTVPCPVSVSCSTPGCSASSWTTPNATSRWSPTAHHSQRLGRPAGGLVPAPDDGAHHINDDQGCQPQQDVLGQGVSSEETRQTNRAHQADMECPAFKRPALSHSVTSLQVV